MFELIKQSRVLLASQVVVLGVFPVASQAFTLQEATISDIESAFKSGELSCSSLTQLYLNRIEAYDKQGPALNAIITTNPNALATAAELDTAYTTSGSTGPLHCIPVILKDNYDTFDLPTTAGALALEGFIPPNDAFQVQKLREAGALILAKANLSEFAFSFDTTSSLGGTTLNPYDTNRVPGGSSGGTAAAIAANFGVIGMGTDTGGSIRIPSTFNSLVGVRPTIGLSSRSGIIPLALSQDVGGPMTRTVEDAAAVLDATVGFDPNDPVTAASIGNIPDSYTDFLDPNGLKGARIGVVRDLFGLDANPEAAKVNGVVNAALEDMKSLGAEIIDSVTISDLDKIFSYPSLSSFEFKFNLNDYLAERPNAPVETLSDIIASGGYLPSNQSTLEFRNSRGPLEDNAQYQDIIKNRPVITQQAILSALAANNLDALVYPTSTQPPALFGQNIITGSANRLSPFSGFPEITVPAGFTPDNLPVGISFLGKAFGESTLLKLTYAYEQGTKERRPPGSTPPLLGETIPESGTATALTLFGLTALGLKFQQRHKIKSGKTHI